MSTDNTAIMVDSNFDGGNIVCLDAASIDNIRLAIRPDRYSHFLQWFYFRVCGGDGERVMRIENAGDAAYLDGWQDYRALASTDRNSWERIPTSYEGGVLTLRHRASQGCAWYAYFAPYSMERHFDLIARCAAHPAVRQLCLGHSLDGQPLDLLRTGDGDLQIWVIARQHPGEVMAEWWMEGFLARLLDDDDDKAMALRRAARLHIVPNMNPDGSRRGHLRTNAAGVNLNREWGASSLARSPEVFYVERAMEASGVHLALDVHGDEGLPYAFIAGANGVPGFSDADARLLESYKRALCDASDDFQTEHGYTPDAPGAADMSIHTNQIAHRHRCLAMTLEMPFKDNADRPDAKYGWSPEHCRKLGAANIDAMHAVLQNLR